MQKQQPHDYKSISLFSGAMGLDVGLERAGIDTVLCVENDPAAQKTITLNRPDLVVLDDVKTTSLATIAKHVDPNDIDLIVGGPPCQSFSVFGRRKGMKDERGALLLDFVRLIDEVRPTAFLMENVRGLLSMKLDADPELSEAYSAKGGLFRWLQQKFREIGYRTDTFVVNSVNYGAPQNRERVLIIGNRLGHVAKFPNPTRSNRPEDNLPPFSTLGDVIGEGFRDPDPDCMNFSERKLRYLSMVPPGGNWRHLPEKVQKESMGKSWYLKGGRSAYWRKLSYDHPSPALTTMPNHAGTSMCHPTELRALTCGEYAAIQEFPKNWQFSGTPTEKCRQIGNAVPVRLAEIAGRVLIKLLNTSDKLGLVDPTCWPKDTETHLRPHVRTRSYWKDGKVLAGHADYVRPSEGPLPLFEGANH